MEGYRRIARAVLDRAFQDIISGIQVESVVLFAKSEQLEIICAAAGFDTNTVRHKLLEMLGERGAN